jgi:hypothetical protein
MSDRRRAAKFSPLCFTKRPYPRISVFSSRLAILIPLSVIKAWLSCHFLPLLFGLYCQIPAGTTSQYHNKLIWVLCREKNMRQNKSAAGFPDSVRISF